MGLPKRVVNHSDTRGSKPGSTTYIVGRAGLPLGYHGVVRLNYFLAWFPMVAIAIVNGAIREKGYKQALGELRAHQVSTLTGGIAFAIYIWGLSRIWPLESAGQSLGIGLMWVAMTVAFEFLFGRYAARRPWSALLVDYNLLAGRVWALLLIWLAVAPYVFWRWRR